jgi:hypothetical protein
MWKEYLDERLTTEQFQQAVKKVIIESRAFPTAKELAEAIKGDADSEALLAWDECVRAILRSDDEFFHSFPLDSSIRFAVRSVGGRNSIALTQEDDLRWLKKEFTRAYKAHQLNPSLSREGKTLTAGDVVSRMFDKSRKQFEGGDLE